MIFNTPERCLKKILRRTNGALTVDSLDTGGRKISVMVIADGIIYKCFFLNTKSKYLEAFKTTCDGRKILLNETKTEPMTEIVKFNDLVLLPRWA